MILTDTDILARLAVGDLVVSPLADDAMQPASVELHLGRQFLGYAHPERIIQVDPTDPDRPQTEPMPTENDGSILLTPLYLGGPQSFLLGHTAETLTIPTDLAARVEGKSSLGRIGCAIHITAAFVDPGFSGQITLELLNLSPVPIRLHPGMRIGQLCLLQALSPSSASYGDQKYGSHYQGQTGARGASPVARRNPLAAPAGM